ncbi:hypothetical protein HanRHA438_Chr16g0780801 [Helianthus annuus]|nr:hypothetical protein HanRHA438_Chr16g0780801 [Helianthus annuus]
MFRLFGFGFGSRIDLGSDSRVRCARIRVRSKRRIGSDCSSGYGLMFGLRFGQTWSKPINWSNPVNCRVIGLNTNTNKRGEI